MIFPYLLCHLHNIFDLWLRPIRIEKSLKLRPYLLFFAPFFTPFFEENQAFFNYDKFF